MIPIHKPFLEEDDFQAVCNAVKSTFVSGDGPECRDFEKALANYLGIKNSLFLNSCTAALDLAYRVKNFSFGSEVIVPNFTYTSTALGPLLNNLQIILCDVDPLTGNIDVTEIEKLVNKKTVAISPVDYAGRPADMDKIIEIAQIYNLYIIHDTAQSIGARYKGRLTGTLADISTFSFHGTKNITTGEGGAIITNDNEIAQRIKIMREKGTDKYSFLSDPEKKGFYEYIDIGNSYVQSNILGALGLSQIKKVDYITTRRKQIANLYYSELSGLSQIQLPPISPDYESNWHIFYLLVPEGKRNMYINNLREEGVSANVHYTPLHMNKFYQNFGRNRELKNSVKFFNSLVRIPIYPSLSEQEIDKVIFAVKKVTKRNYV